MKIEGGMVSSMFSKRKISVVLCKLVKGRKGEKEEEREEWREGREEGRERVEYKQDKRG